MTKEICIIPITKTYQAEVEYREGMDEKDLEEAALKELSDEMANGFDWNDAPIVVSDHWEYEERDENEEH